MTADDDLEASGIKPTGVTRELPGLAHQTIEKVKINYAHHLKIYHAKSSVSVEILLITTSHKLIKSKV
jgi:hypothetical protein